LRTASGRVVVPSTPSTASPSTVVRGRYPGEPFGSNVTAPPGPSSPIAYVPESGRRLSAGESVANVRAVEGAVHAVEEPVSRALAVACGGLELVDYGVEIRGAGSGSGPISGSVVRHRRVDKFRASVADCVGEIGVRFRLADRCILHRRLGLDVAHVARECGHVGRNGVPIGLRSGADNGR